MHTNYDVLRMGRLAGERMGLTDDCVRRVNPFMVPDISGNEYIRLLLDSGPDHTFPGARTYGSMKRVNNLDFIGRRLIRLIQEDISYYAMHTNYDVLPEKMLFPQELHTLSGTQLLPVVRSSRAPTRRPRDSALLMQDIMGLSIYLQRM